MSSTSQGCYSLGTVGIWTPDFAELAYPGISWQSKLNPEPSGTAQCIFNLCQFFSVPDSFGSFGCSSFGSHTWTRRQGRDQHLTAVVQKISKHVQRHKDHVSWWAHLCWWSADYQIHINSKENWMKYDLYVYIYIIMYIYNIIMYILYNYVYIYNIHRRQSVHVCLARHTLCGQPESVARKWQLSPRVVWWNPHAIWCPVMPCDALCI